MGGSVMPSAATVPDFRPGDIVYAEPLILDSFPGDCLATYDTAGVVVRGRNGQLRVVPLCVEDEISPANLCYLQPLSARHHATQLDAVAAAAHRTLRDSESLVAVCKALIERVELAKQEGM